MYERITAWILLIIFGLIVVHAPLTVVMGVQFPALSVAIKAWKEVLLVVAVVLVGIEVTRRRKFCEFARDRLLQLAVAFATLHFLIALFSPQGAGAVLAGLAIDVRYVAYFVTLYIFLRLYPHWWRRFVAVGVGGAGVVLGFALLQTVLPKDFLTLLGYSEKTIMPYLTVDKNPDYIRINSTLRGPNPLGAYAMMALSGVLAYGLYRFRRLTTTRKALWFEILALGAVVALWLSYSRSALIAALVAIAVVIVTRFDIRFDWRQWLGVSGVALFIISAGFLARDTPFISNVILHNNPTTGASIDSNTAHATSLADGLKTMLHEPLGRGIGSTGSASLMSDAPIIVENQFLFVAHEAGWLGLAIFIVLLVVLFRRLRPARGDWLGLAIFASGLGMLIIGLMLPVWTDDTVSIIWWGFAAIVLAKEGNYERTTNKKTA